MDEKFNLDWNRVKDFSLGLSHDQELSDIGRAIEIAHTELSVTPLDSPHRVFLLIESGSLLSKRYEQTGMIEDLDDAIKVVNMAVDDMSPDHPALAGALGDLAKQRHMRFELTGLTEDLDHAIEIAAKAVKDLPQDHPDFASLLGNFGYWHMERYEHIGSMADLADAIKLIRMVLDRAPMYHPDRARWLGHLGNCFGRRFQVTGSYPDLDRAIEVTREALGEAPSDHPSRGAWLVALGNQLGMRFERRTELQDLEEAIQMTAQSLDATPNNHPDLAYRLENFGSRLGQRFERMGEMHDIDRAIDLASLALDKTPRDHSDRACRLESLSNKLGQRFKKTGEKGDIDRAIELAGLALDTTPRDHSDRACRLESLSNKLGQRFKKTGEKGDIDQAIEFAALAVEATPKDHPDLARRLESLGNQCGRRFADALCLEKDPMKHRFFRVFSQMEWIGKLHWAGDEISWQSEATGQNEDLQRSLSCFEEGWMCQNAPPILRIRLAWCAASLLALLSKWEEASHLLSAAVHLLPTICPPSLQYEDREHILSQFTGICSIAAAAALNAGKGTEHALQLLEAGRGIIVDQLFQARKSQKDLSELRLHHRDLVEAFENIREDVDSFSAERRLPPSATRGESLDKQRRLADPPDLLDIVQKIRRLPGFDDFLLPAQDDFALAADPDPAIVLNASPYRCDAFIVEPHQTTAVELPQASLEILEKYHESGANVLEELWNSVASPCLQALGFEQSPADGNWPHVWWIPTGPFSNVPIHAAGRHAEGSTDTVLDKVMSSYSISLRALICARRQSAQMSPSQDPSQESGRALIIAADEVPGMQRLPFASSETHLVKQICPLLNLSTVELPHGNRAEVLTQLPQCQIFHFAGVARTRQSNPWRSSIYLANGPADPLTVADICNLRLDAQGSSPFLSYLSTCDAAGMNLNSSVDEQIHLASACQVAGFRHVIGTFGSVHDETCADVARGFYQAILSEGMTDRGVYRGLHRATMMLRDKEDPTYPSTWISFVHFGV
ncbi:CHAT domain-containing protein [Thelonectria olida]|uniref:CHAT domain-containing protein n=1 Tax=Thelonectria olida TaxID=1576542 RepID=A0A9P9AKF0_9HYPO|nr:CHAT domain-containing protein [Thelonectria olida]